MGLRIREYQHRRKLEAEKHRQKILLSEARRFQQLAWSKDAADREFLKKLQNIRELIKSAESAVSLAEQLENDIHRKFQKEPIHKDLLASVILDLL